MTAPRAAPALAFGVALLSWLGSSALLPLVNERREAERLDYSVSDQNLPPQMAMVVVLGSFRGWFINYLWLRASRLQDEGQFHEALQLTEWITELQPHFRRVWFFHAHNMATNISYASFAPADRWGWVREAIRLLRDGALEKNPFDARLHDDLANLFTGRIEPARDRTHWYNKREHALEWQRLLGAPPAGDRAAFAEWLRPIAEALPGAGTAWERSRELREVYRMDPALMRALTIHFGPLDWRHPAAHGLYWAALGELRERGRDLEPKLPESEAAAGARLGDIYANLSVRGALRQLLRSGRMQYEPHGDYFVRRPEPEFALPLERAFETLRPAGRLEALRAEYRRDLENCLEYAWVFGEEDAARRFLARLRANFGTMQHGAPYPEALEEFARVRSLVQLESSEGGAEERAKNVLNATMHRLALAYIDGAANGRVDVAGRLERVAFLVHEACAERGWVPRLDAAARATLLVEALEEALLASPALADPLSKRRLWRSSLVPAEWKAAVHPRVERVLEAEMAQAGIEWQSWFHVPPAEGASPPR